MNLKPWIIRLVFLQLFVLSTCVHPVEHKYSLILVEFDKDSHGVNQTQTLMRYTFVDGVLEAKESILTTKTNELRYDLGENQIYAGRYVITMWGDVVDLRTKQMLFKSTGELVGIDKKTSEVIVRVDREDDEDIYAFNLQSRHYRRIAQPRLWATAGTLSPNGRLRAAGDGDQIWLHHPDGKKTFLGKNFSREGTVECSAFGTPTFVWLDDNHLLTQRGNGHLVIVDVQGRIRSLVTIPNVDAQPCGPELLRDDENHIYYEEKEKAWRIDVTNRTFEPYLWEADGNSFEMEYARDDSYGRVIRYRGSEIGRWWCDTAVTGPGHIAVKFGLVGSNLGHPEGVKVWSADNGAWTTIKPDWLGALVGWIVE